MVRIEYVRVPTEAAVGEDVEMELAIERPAAASGPVRVGDLDRKGDIPPDVVFDFDSFPRDVSLRPGELLRVVLPFRVNTARELDLGEFWFAVKEGANETVAALPPRILSVRPALARELTLELASISRYSLGVKVHASFRHGGKSKLEDVTVRFEPAEAIRAGKAVWHWAEFYPGDVGEGDLIVAGDTLTVAMSARMDGKSISARIRRPIPSLTDQVAPPPFRFLEPRHLANDRVMLFEATPTGSRDVVGEHAVFPVRGGVKYVLHIEPRDASVSEITLPNLPGTLHVVGQSRDDKLRRWTFRFDVTANELLTRGETLYYETARTDGKALGEIALSVRPSAKRHYLFALATGVALTVQGATALFKAVADSQGSLLEALGDLKLGKNYPILFLAGIPLFWLGIKLVDWLNRVSQRGD